MSLKLTPEQVSRVISEAVAEITASIPDTDITSEASRHAIVTRMDEAALLVFGMSLGLYHDEEVLARISAERNPYLRPLLDVAHRAMSNTSVHGQ